MTPEHLRSKIELLKTRASAERLGHVAADLKELLEFAGFTETRTLRVPPDAVRVAASEFWRRVLGISPESTPEDLRRSALFYYAMFSTAARGTAQREMVLMAREYAAELAHHCDRYLSLKELTGPTGYGAPEHPPPRNAPRLKVVGGRDQDES